jgi:4-amino-4-deoxy-L-arabinose transferase-like glycosyltransferase
MTGRNTANNVFLIAAFCIAAFLLFRNLGNEYLWQDEAETAVLAKNIFISGLPAAYDGKNTVLLLDMPEFSKNYMFGRYWMGQPWLAIYIANLSFRLLGVSTFAARLPFALIGISSFALIYLLARKLFRDRAVANISLALSVLSVPLILHMRQCRYFSPGIFLTILCVYLYLFYIEERKFSSPALLFALFLLLNTSISYFLGVASAITIHLAATRKKAFFSARNIMFFAVLALYALPFFYLFRLPRRMELNMHWIIHNLKYYIRAVNKYIFPWRSLVILYACYAVVRRRLSPYMPKEDRKAVSLLVLLICVSLVFLMFVDFNTLRYIIQIAPLFFILEAYILARLMRKSKYLVVCCVLPILILTNIFSISFPLRSYLLPYLYEITHDYDGPSEGIIKYLNKNAHPEDSVRVMHRFDNPLIFYTNLKIENMPPFERDAYPEWIVINDYWNRGFRQSEYYSRVMKRYDEITLPYPDIPWENRPDDMGFHKFKTDTRAPRVKIYKRRDS